MQKEHVHIFSSHDMPKRNFKYFEEMRNKNEFCDFTIQVGSESISAHRVIVMAAIPFFRDVLSPESPQAAEEGTVLPDIDPSALKSLIEFAYTCQMRISEENVRSILCAACHLHVDEVRDACLDFLWNNLEPENAISIQQLLDDLDCSDLSKKIDCYVREYFESVSQTDDFLKCSVSYLKELIQKDELNVTDEKNLLQSVMNWVKTSPDERKVHLPDLLTNIRMSFLEPLYMIDIVKNEDLIRKSWECRDLIDQARNYISFPEMRSEKYSFKTQPRKSLATVADVNQEQSSFHIWKLCFLVKCQAQHFNPADAKYVTTDGRSFHANDGSAAEMDNKIYYFRWGDTLKLNQENSECEFLNPMPTPRIFTGASRLKDKIYLCGGEVGRVASNVVECFNPKECKWTKVRSMPRSLWGPSVVTLGDCIYVLGGQDHRDVYSCVERYDPMMDKWQYIPSMIFKRSFAGAAVLCNEIYVCGGNTAVTGITAITACEVYNSITRNWKTIKSMNTPRCWHALLRVGGKLYAVGGEDNKKTVKCAEIYEPTSNEWTKFPSKGTEIQTSAAVVVHLSGT